jgi:hypothetical protein
LDDLAVLARELRAVQGDVRSRFADPYYDTALIIQAVVVGLLAFALLGAIESFHVMDPYYHVNVEPLIRLSLLVTGGFMLALVGVIWLLLRRSSYAPRLIIENCFLMVPVAFAGFQIVSDVNRTWDRSSGWIVSYRVDDLKKVYHQRRLRGRKLLFPYYTYHARISALSPSISYPVAVPGRLDINSGLYKELSQTKQLSMEIGEGALGVPWYRDMWAGPLQP